MDAITGFLLYFVFPLWIAVGVADYLCHRATQIERTSGTAESVFHLAQLGQVGLPLLAGLLLELTVPILLLMAVAALVHTLTAWRDVAYSEPRRRITPFEQIVHGFLIVIPVVGAALVVAQHWEGFSALWSAAPVDWSLRPKTVPIPLLYLAAVLLPSAVFGVLPAAEEFVRCRRAAATLGSHPAETELSVYGVSRRPKRPEER
jgi:hypothetical protein